MFSDCGSINDDIAHNFTVDINNGQFYGDEGHLNCTSGHRINDTDETSQAITCQEDGRWSLTHITCFRKGKI